MLQVNGAQSGNLQDMTRKAVLLASATLWLGATAAEADSSKLGWFGSLDGGWSFVNGGETIYAINRSGYPDFQERNVNLSGGVQGSVMLGYRFNSGWDFGLRVGALVTKENSDFTYDTGPDVPPFDSGLRPPLSSGGPVPDDYVGNQRGYEFDTAKGAADLTQVMVDFEAGYDLGMGEGSSLRLFGGLRLGFIDVDTQMSFGGGGVLDGELRTERSSSFVGAGPRLGVQGALDLGGGFSLFGGLGGSVLLGQMQVSYLTQAYGYSGSNQVTEARVVYQLDGEVGVGFALTDAGVLGEIQVGVRGSQSWNAVDGSTPSGVIDPPLSGLAFGDSHEDITAYGPFVRLVFQF